MRPAGESVKHISQEEGDYIAVMVLRLCRAVAKDAGYPQVGEVALSTANGKVDAWHE